MSDWGTEEQRILRSLRVVDEPTDEDRVRVGARLETELSLSLGLGATLVGLAATSAPVSGVTAAGATVSGVTASSTTTGAVSAATAKSAGSALGLVGLGKWSVAVAFVGAAGWAASTWPNEGSKSATEMPKPNSSAPSVPASPAVARESAPLLAPPATIPEPETAAPPRASTPAQANVPSKSHGLEDELALIGDAQKALAQNEAARALTLLERHAREYPRGTLQLERGGLLAIASCQAGRTTEGRSRATRFLSAHPNSPLSARIRKSCQLPE